MKVSESWLREWVNPELDAAEIGHQLTMAGVELDGIEGVASEFTGVIVAEILTAEQHPDADRLRVCSVDDGSGTPIQIVCGAPNARAGLKAPLAIVGAALIGGDGKKFKIKKSKLRGVESQGMLCSSTELGLDESADGLLELAADAPVGTDIREYLSLNDVVLELDATPNRADCLSIAGIAREVGVLSKTELSPPVIEDIAAIIDDVFPVALESLDGCQRLAGRVLRNVNTQAETPLWMVEKLRRVGIRSLGPVVDVTNYVMIELGQPMHSFDLDKLNGGIRVRQAEDGEKLTLLDDRTIELRADTLVIADHEKAVALAGIMGGLDCSVSETTKNLFLEVAYFVPENMMGKARSYGMHTDASHRFERGVSPDLQIQAIQRATALILEICGGEAGPVNDQQSDPLPRQRGEIEFPAASIKRRLGIEVDAGQVEDILKRLGCEVSASVDGWKVLPPLFRFDLANKEDLIEEIARVHGYDQIPSVLRAIEPRMVNRLETVVDEQLLRQSLVDEGYQEAVTYSFVPAEIEAMLCPDSEQIRLANPISEELAVMRSSLWCGLLPALVKNLNRQQSRVRLFETGLNFVQQGGEISQRKQLAGLITGARSPEHWNAGDEPVDFFDVKGHVERLLGVSDHKKFSFEAAEHPALHPGQSARVMRGDAVVGWVGALHPALESSLDISQRVYLFELDVAYLIDKPLPAYQKLSRFPSIRRDLALLVSEDVTAGALDEVLNGAGISALQQHQLFDVYQGKGVEAGQKSLALGLIFQDFSRTLEDADINGYVEQIVQLLKNKAGATLRQ